MMFRLAVLLFLSCAGICSGQDTLRQMVKDSTRFKDIFLRAKPEVHVRSVLMSTWNRGALKDDHALAGGLGLGFTSGTYRGFQAGMSLFVIYNIWSSDLTKPDPTTLQPNRYETGLFDLEHPDKKLHLLRLENLFLRYSFSRTSVTLGRMKLNTPFLNTQDGRMNVTMEEGIWVKTNQWRKAELSGGWFWSISPRSTTHWYPVAHTLGIYPSGVTVTGAPSDYYGNITSSGIALVNAVASLGKKTKLFLWDMFVENVMNSAMIEIHQESGKKVKCFRKLLFIHQDAVRYGGNRDQARTYMPAGAQSNAVSGQLGLKNTRLYASVNFTYITGDGRYLAPREWGSDPFYTFMAREKNDGFGNVMAGTAHAAVYFFKEKMRCGLIYGYFHLPDVNDYRLNKYGMPSYHQVNSYITYEFKKNLKGLQLIMMNACKIRQGKVYDDPKHVYNRVNLLHVGLFVNYRI